MQTHGHGDATGDRQNHEEPDCSRFRSQTVFEFFRTGRVLFELRIEGKRRFFVEDVERGADGSERFTRRWLPGCEKRIEHTIERRRVRIIELT